MFRPLKAAAATALLLASGACSTTHFGGVAETPNPAPPPGYRVVCSSVPTILNGFTTLCLPVQELLIEQGVVQVAPFITHRYRALDDVGRAFGTEFTLPEYTKGIVELA